MRRIYFTAYIVSLLIFSSCSQDGKKSDSELTYNNINIEAPFTMEPIKEIIYPNRDFVVTDYGAVADTTTLSTDAFHKAILACNAAGGGRVVVPAGDWLTGPIHFKSNVELHLSEGSTIHFEDNPELYLPAVPTSWEGMECYNYSPLLYAYNCENITISGTGCFAPRMNTWRVWFAREEAHMKALADLYHMMSQNIPIEQRQMAQGENRLRPHLIHFNRCRNINLLDFKIRESPFWTIHLYMSDNILMRGLDVKAYGHNNDGVDIEKSSNALVEDCRFDQGDDAIVIKAGRNLDGWITSKPTKNIVVRECNVAKGHTLVGIGSELSGGIENIYIHNCTMSDYVEKLLFIKTNHRRGGIVKNIYMENIEASGSMNNLLGIATDVLYQWRDLVPTYETRYTKISDIFLNNIKCREAKVIYDIQGDSNEPIIGVHLENITVDRVLKCTNITENADSISVKNLNYNIL